MRATALVMAAFRATVGIPTTPDGATLPCPEVKTIHSDHEGQYESYSFLDFRADNSLHHTMSPPHDHDLNPIAERIIGVIDSLSRAAKSSSGAPVGFWPYLILNAVNWHNTVPGSTGSSTSNELISPYQRFTLRQPACKDMCCFGARTVVLKPKEHQSKGTLATRGWLGCFMGRSQTSKGA